MFTGEGIQYEPYIIPHEPEIGKLVPVNKHNGPLDYLFSAEVLTYGYSVSRY